MNQTERLYRIQHLIREFAVVPRARFLDELEISLATFKRDLAYLRDRLHAPIEYDSEQGGYRFTIAQLAPRYEVPGMWFNAEEIYALLTMQQLLQQMQPGLLTPHIQPMLSRLNLVLAGKTSPDFELQKRIRIHRINARPVQPKAFDPVCAALLSRRQIEIEYFSRGRNVCETRALSPQRLTYYRDNWYLDAWCHLRQSFRSFSLDAIVGAKLLDEGAFEIPDADLDAVTGPGYGIFSGAMIEWATLKFSSERARWVGREVWHPQQEMLLQPDGTCILRVPYSDDRELVMDILRHVPEVTVLGPKLLQQRVRSLLEQALHSFGQQE
ncbi:putative DNA-binding transcriptional regulator YafY [Janthinobacterium sp. CG_23.3]|uniref:helix-turn-helix transcriptional regulator n=1 Tax=Janthinobacterium sp. CG_23.3 TaxID=3349634 RepID=UPI0038D4BEB1